MSMCPMPKVFSISTNPAAALKDAVALILEGSVIAVPTDTLYGLACNANSNHAINRLYGVKQRVTTNPLAICVADIEDVYKWCHVTVSRQLLESLLPGQVTLVFKRLHNLNHNLNPLHQKVAVRIPDSDFVRSVARNSNAVLALTSANISSRQSCLEVEEFSTLWPLIDRVYDGGPLHDKDPERLGSTIVDLSTEGQYAIQRNGCAFSFVSKILSQFNLSSNATSNGR